LKDEDADVRGIAAVALGNIGDASAVEPLILAFKDRDLSVKRSVSEALAEIKDDRAVSVLDAAIHEKGSAQIVCVVYAFFIRRGIPGTEDVLIKSLNDHGDPGMAEDFLNCGNSKLAEAGRLWIKGVDQDFMHLPIRREKPVWGQEK